MTAALLPFLAVLSIWDYPARQPQHERLRAEFVQAVRAGDTKKMEESSRKGTELLPDDPTWAYNLACSLAYREKPGGRLGFIHASTAAKQVVIEPRTLEAYLQANARIKGISVLRVRR